MKAQPSLEYGVRSLVAWEALLQVMIYSLKYLMQNEGIPGPLARRNTWNIWLRPPLSHPNDETHNCYLSYIFVIGEPSRK